MRCWPIALVVFLLPTTGVHAAWLVAMHFDLVPSCFPYVSGCTSISATGRMAPASFLFKGTVIPAAVFFLVYWLLHWRWLEATGLSAGRKLWLLPLLGSISAVFLVMYAIFLGTEGQTYEFLRQHGVRGFFAATFLAQLLSMAWQHRAMKGRADLIQGHRIQWLLVIAMLAMGWISVYVDANIHDSKVPERVLEWNFAAAMIAWFLISAWLWGRSQYRLAFHAV